ncbi:MAG: ABC transporter permease [Puniceicoccales bacterium]|nr:ABC transporter permease [Puniceicoccales bacterium]
MFAFVSILGVALGVTALLVVQTVMNSFGEEHRRRIRDANGDVLVLTRHNSPVPVSFAAALAKMRGVLAAAPYAEDGIVVMGNDRFDLNLVRGIDPAVEDNVTPVKKYLATGKWEDFDDERIILGAGVAHRLGVRIGDIVTVQSPKKILAALEAHEDGKRVSQPKDLEVCGILETGFRLADEKTMLVTLRTARDLFDIPDGTAPRIHIKLRDHQQTEACVRDIMGAKFAIEQARQIQEERGDELLVHPWYMVNRVFLESVDMEKQMLFFLMFIITLVASFSIGSTMFSHVVRRTREIGLLSALGARPVQILRIFVGQGLFIGVAGYGLGVVFALLILHFRQEIVSLLGAQERLSMQYLFSRVPLHYAGSDFVKAAALTIILITLVSLFPALWAARRKPSEAMRDVAQ